LNRPVIDRSPQSSRAADIDRPSDPQVTRNAYQAVQLDSAQWADPRWRLSNLYWIVDEQGNDVRFRPNDIQLRFLDELHLLNCVLKSRQHGFTTIIALMILDQCVFRPNIAAGIIAHTVGDAKRIFRTKVQHPYNKLPALVRQANHLVNDSQSEFIFANGSAISVGTSMRSGTLQFLHVSEFGKISAKWPDKALEIVTGSFNTVNPGQYIFVESTAEGRVGAYPALVKQSRALMDSGKPLSPLDFKFHFYPWYQKKSNRIDARLAVVEQEMDDYFEELRVKHGIAVDDDQRAWYIKKREQMLVAGGSGVIDGDLLMRREHPSYPDEAFQAAAEGAYYAREMVWLRKNARIRSLPIVTTPVFTFWDLGRKDRTVIWFMQRVGPECRFIDYYENSGELVNHYVRILNERPYIYGQHYLPHDATAVHLESPDNKSYYDRLWDLGVRNVTVVGRIDSLGFGIEAVRQCLPQCWFDEVRCARGLEHLENYRKSWNETVGDWHDYPVDDESCHAADAFRQFAQSGIASRPGETDSTRTHRQGRRHAHRHRNWRTA
jgi:hypothetical protein